MITCPWCGTNYAVFQPNCQNCGGPLPAVKEVEAFSQEATPVEPAPEAPPLAPRPIPDSYAWKLMFNDGWSIAGLVFGILGAVFSCVGVMLTIFLVTAFVGVPFALLGLLFLGAGVAAIAWRYQQAAKTVRVLQVGQAVLGEITSLEQNYNVRVNGRNPWNIGYRFQALGRAYEGSVTTLNTPGPHLQVGRAVYVLYLPDTPEHNAIYPHP